MKVPLYRSRPIRPRAEATEIFEEYTPRRLPARAPYRRKGLGGHAPTKAQSEDVTPSPSKTKHVAVRHRSLKQRALVGSLLGVKPLSADNL